MNAEKISCKDQIDPSSSSPVFDRRTSSRQNLAFENFSEKEILGSGATTGSYFSYLNRDPGRRKRIEDLVVSLRQQLATAQHIAKLASWTMDIQDGPDGDGFKWSPELYALLKYDATNSNPTFEDYLALFKNQSQNLIEIALADTMNGGGANEFELELIPVAGRPCWVGSRIEAICDEDKNPVSILCTLQDITERKNLEKDGEERAKRIEELAHRLLDTQERERMWLSSELHDRSSANLAAIAMNFQRLSQLICVKDRALEDILSDTQALLEDTTHSIRDICFHLRPALLDHAGLWPTLKSYSMQFMRRHGIGIDLTSNMEDCRLPPLVETKLFRIVQEALLNAAKHSQATSIHITLDCTEKSLLLLISDNGVGFDASSYDRNEKTPGLGMVMMRERAKFMDGELKVESTPGGGTKVFVSLPIQNTMIMGAK